MVELNILEILLDEKEFLIKWEISNDIKKIFKHEDLVVKYDSKIEQNPVLALNIFLSTFLPILVGEYGHLRVSLPFKISDDFTNYWMEVSEVISKIKLVNSYELDFMERNTWVCEDLPDMSNSNNIGLYFGGGVESSFALSQLDYLNPILISIIGKGWMNNDPENAKIKLSIENQLENDNDIKIERIETNARFLINRGDEFVNKYSTGYMFYFLAIPLARIKNIGVLYKCSELEEALNFSKDYDYSLKPNTTIKITGKTKKYPLFVPIYNSFSKVQMFEELSKTKYIKYLNSCFIGGSKRWCGNCSKCFRISEYCEAVGLDKSVIGMQEGIVGVRERSPITKHYWDILEKLYGKNFSERYVKKIKYYKKMGLYGFTTYKLRPILRYIKYRK